MTYRLAPGVARVSLARGPALFTSAPLRVVRVNGALDALLAAPEIAPRTPAEARALEALCERGLLRRERPRVAGRPLPSVTVVVPVKDRAGELRRCLASLRAVRYPPELLEVVVVDDGSRDGSADVARAHGVHVVASGGEGRGPAAARNRGAAVASGEVLAFIDSDCTASPEWLAELVDRFEDPATAAVGGRVDGLRGDSALDRYEAEMSSLFLGTRERAGSAGRDTFYLPSCNLLVRRRAFVESGGFREALHVGEDVDLTWRLRERGGRIVYVPEGRVRHAHRNRLGAFVRRRFEYGTSEAVLHALHPARRKRLPLPPVLAAVALSAGAAAVTGEAALAAAAAAIVAVDALRLRRRLRRTGLPLGAGRILAARLRAVAGLAHGAAFHLVRYYAPLLLLGGLLAPRLAVVGAALLVACAAVDHRVRRPGLAFPPFLALYGLEHLAYAAGAFAGCLRQRSFASYRISFAAREP